MNELMSRLVAAIYVKASLAKEAQGGPWGNEDEPGEVREVPNGGTVAFTPRQEDGQFIAANDPQVVLRRCAADQRLVKLWRVVNTASNASPDMRTVMDEVMRHLADGYGITSAGTLQEQSQ
jgi:hypothetical protein